MSYTAVEDLIAALESGAQPNGDVFANLIKSVWHKSEKIPVEQVDKLNIELDKLLLRGNYNGNATDIINLVNEIKTELRTVQISNLGRWFNSAAEATSFYNSSSPTPEDGFSFRVLNEGDSSENGHYAWDSTEADKFDFKNSFLELAEDGIKPLSENAAKSGKTYSFVKDENRNLIASGAFVDNFKDNSEIIVTNSPYARII